jgi:hypothetical protein
MMGSKVVNPKYLVDQESFSFAEYWLSDEYAEDAGLSHTELLYHKWELANQVQMCVEDYFNHDLREDRISAQPERGQE